MKVLIKSANGSGLDLVSNKLGQLMGSMEFDTDGNLRNPEEKRIKNWNQHEFHDEDVEGFNLMVSIDLIILLLFFFFFFFKKILILCMNTTLFWSFNTLLVVLDGSATLKTNHNFKDQIDKIGTLGTKN